jgi:hypothetical protein
MRRFMQMKASETPEILVLELRVYRFGLSSGMDNDDDDPTAR